MPPTRPVILDTATPGPSRLAGQRYYMRTLHSFSAVPHGLGSFAKMS